MYTFVIYDKSTGVIDTVRSDSGSYTPEEALRRAYGDNLPPDFPFVALRTMSAVDPSVSSIDLKTNTVVPKTDPTPQIEG